MVDSVLTWTADIKNGRDSKGTQLKSVDTMKLALEDAAKRKETMKYQAKKILVQEKFVIFFEKYISQLDNDGNKKKCMKSIDPIVLPVIKATAQKHNELKL